jgi:hypothetical protein
MKAPSPILPALVLVLVAGVSAAQAPATAKQQKLIELLTLMRLDQAYAISKKGCIDATLNGAFSPGKVAEKDGQYGGFTPKSAAWPAVLRAYERYAAASCTPMTLAETRRRYLEFYGPRVSEKDLDALLRFLRSSPGRAFVTVQDEFLHALGDETQRRSLAAAADAQVILDRDLAKLKQQPMR